MNRSEDITLLIPALFEAKKHIKKAEASSKGNYGMYSNISDLYDTIEVAEQYGLTIMHDANIENGFEVLLTQMIHTSGQYIEDKRFILPDTANSLTKHEAAVTFARKSSIKCLFGLSTGDEGEEDGKQIYLTKTQKKAIEDLLDAKKPYARECWQALCRQVNAMGVDYIHPDKYAEAIKFINGWKKE